MNGPLLSFKEMLIIALNIRKRCVKIELLKSLQRFSEVLIFDILGISVNLKLR